MRSFIVKALTVYLQDKLSSSAVSALVYFTVLLLCCFCFHYVSKSGHVSSEKF